MIMLPEPYTLADLFDAGIMKFLLNKGEHTINRYTYKRYVEVFEAYLKKSKNITRAVEYTSDECGCSERTINRARSALKK